MEKINCLNCKEVVGNDRVICPECGCTFFKLDYKYLYKDKEVIDNKANLSKLAAVNVKANQDCSIKKNVFWDNEEIVPSLLWEWREDYELGIKSVDVQHQQILVLINKIYDSIKNKRREHKFNSSVINMLDAYVKEHFKYEEKLFFAAKYPEIKDHKIQHRNFEHKVSELNKKFEREFFDLKEVLEFLVGWFLEHTQESDKKFSKFILDKKKSA